MSDMQTIYSDIFYSTSWGGLVMMEASHEELNFVGLQINSAKKNKQHFLQQNHWAAAMYIEIADDMVELLYGNGT